eukprot:gene2054-1894_t
MLAVWLEQKHSISLVCTNMRGYHRHFLPASSSAATDPLAALHAAMVAALLAASRPKATVDCVVGDRGRIVFNAARPCAGHRAAAALAAVHVSSARRPDGELVSEKGVGAVAACARALGADACEISVGAASGGAVVGNVGAAEL